MTTASPKRQAAASSVDLAEAQAFLDLLDPEAEGYTFQCFDDNPDKPSRNHKLTRVLHGKLADHAATLERLNQQGAGVFVSVNETDLHGRKKANIVRVRALMLDLDGAPLDPVYDCALKPHAIVETSPGHFHGTLRVDGLALDQFDDVQRALAKRFNGDPEVAKLTQLQRLPGFRHCKAQDRADWFQSRIVESHDGPTYSAEEVLAEFPPEQVAHKVGGSISAGLLVLHAEAPRFSAREFTERHYRNGDLTTLIFYRDSFYEFQGTHYRLRSHALVRAKVYDFLDDAVTPNKKKDGHGFVPFNPTSTKVNAVLDALESGILEPIGDNDELDMPFWRKPLQDKSADNLIACRNGLLDLSTRKLAPHDPHFVNTVCLPFDFDPDAPPPKRWLKFLKQLWPDDPDAIDLLQEIFGYLLTAETRAQKIFLIIGPRRSGKGTIGRVLTALLDRDNVVNPTLASMSGEFGLQSFIDKRLAIVADARLHKNAAAVVERLLSISGEDAQTVNRKMRDFWSGHLGVRFLLLANKLPDFSDVSNALVGRFVLLTLKNKFYDKEDLWLTDKLTAELTGIFNWSLDGLDRLREYGMVFQMPASSKDMLRTFEDLANPLGEFVGEWCVVGFTDRIEVKVLYDAWARWAEQNGRAIGTRQAFGSNLKTALPHVTTHSSGTARYYMGVGLSEEGQEQYDTLKGMKTKRGLPD